MPRLVLCLGLLLSIGCSFPSPAQPAPALASVRTRLSGAVEDPTGASVPGAKVELLDNNGSLITSTVTSSNGQFLFAAEPGTYQLAVLRDGFAIATTPVHLRLGGSPPLLVRLKIAAINQEVNVDASSGVNLTDPAANKDSVTISGEDLRSLPVFDNDYIATLTTLLDPGAISTAGTTLLVDGVEKNRVGVSASAIQSVKINNDPYSAEFYQPGRGQIQITTKPTADTYHGSANFTFRDSLFDARNPFTAPHTKPHEQRRMYFGELTGPILRSKQSAFLFSFTRAEDDLQESVDAITPEGHLQQAVPAPTRNTELSLRLSRQLSPAHTAYLEYQFQDQSIVNQEVGDTVLADAGTTATYLESDYILHDDYILSPTRLNQLVLLLEANRKDIADTHSAPQIVVQGNFRGGSAQAQQSLTEYNVRIVDAFSWTHGKHQVRFGLNLPHLARRAIDDQSLSAGRYTFSSLADYQAGTPLSYEVQQGGRRFVYHDQEAGVFFLDVYQVNPTLTITPGLRYDWNNFTRALDNVSPRFSFAQLVDKKSATVLRGGLGLFYDRAGSGALSEIRRYSDPSLFDRIVQDNPCYPVICPDQIAAAPYNLVRLAPELPTPKRLFYNVSIERRLTRESTLTIGYRAVDFLDLFRSVDINAPTPQTGYTQRPNPAIGRVREIQSSSSARSKALEVNLRGRITSLFTGTLQYTYAHVIADSAGIAFFPQNQYQPGDESASADYDQRHRFNAIFTANQGKPLNLGVQLHFWSGQPYTILRGDDPYNTSLFNARPDGVARNSKNKPIYNEVDLRYAYDFPLQPGLKDKSQTVGFALSAFNVLNTVEGATVENVITSPRFGQVIAALPQRRLQLDLRYTF